MHLTAAVVMMSCSAYFHLFLCQNKKQFNKLMCLDYCGICLMICGSTTSPFYYGFMCEENWYWGKIYLVQVWTFCLIALITTLFSNSKWIKAIAYIIAGYSTTPGIIHLAYYTSAETVPTFYIWPWALGGTTYAAGAILYAMNIPERFYPGKFDIWL